ncbi:MAG: hydroxymethylglutaryl-CoA lyase [Candidatus Nanopelagicales bacterium]|nr:hydroxymethylglutaryl-CoA lyase [Candidatus Nanopelagicales bacterium]
MLDLPAVWPSEDLPKRVTIREVGARDGLQNEPMVVETGVKIEFIQRLAEAGLRVVEAASFVRPDLVPQMADAAEVLEGLDRRPGVEYPVLVPNARGLGRAIDAGAREIGVFASATETFARRNLNCGMTEQMGRYCAVIDGARAAGMRVGGYVSMCFGDPWEGSVAPAQVASVCGELYEAGCDSISLGDTIGVATPGHVSRLVAEVRSVGIPLSAIGVHFHDTYGQALASTYEALRAGVATVDASAGGLGGCPYAKSATGNLATEDLVWMLDGLGIDTGVDLGALVATSTWLSDHLGRPSPSRVVRALSR